MLGEYLMDDWNQKKRRIVEQRQLCGYMNDKKWNELRRAMLEEMPFPPPYIVKWVYKDCEEKDFDEDVYYWGAWKEALSFNDRVYGIAIEWMKIRPRYLKCRGRLIPPELVDASAEFEGILDKYHIPYEQENGTYCIYGYR